MILSLRFQIFVVMYKLLVISLISIAFHLICENMHSTLIQSSIENLWMDGIWLMAKIFLPLVLSSLLMGFCLEILSQLIFQQVLQTWLKFGHLIGGLIYLWFGYAWYMALILDWFRVH